MQFKAEIFKSYISKDEKFVSKNETSCKFRIVGGSQEIYEEPLDWITIPNMFSEDDISELMDFVHEKRRFLTGKEAFMEGVQHIGEGKIATFLFR